jgi:hypothetical protein
MVTLKKWLLVVIIVASLVVGFAVGKWSTPLTPQQIEQIEKDKATKGP